MGDIYHYVEILIFIGLYRPLVVSTQNYTNSKLTYYEENEYPVPRVIDGKKADVAQFPYQIAFKKLMELDRFVTYCGGALIGRKKILSAAHCFVMDANWCEKNCAGKSRVIRLDSRYAVAGTVKNQETKYRSYRQQWRKMAQAIIPKSFAYPNDDIAVVITVNRFSFDAFVNIIPIASVTIDYREIWCNVTGYGRLNVSTTSQYLMWASLDLVNASICSKMHKMNMEKFICTYATYANIMEGDSGGPLVCANTGDPNEGDHGIVVGVVTGARNPGGSFFTRVSSYYSYISLNNNASISTINLICLFILISYYIKFLL